MYAISPLRYPGAKWRLDGFISALIKDNKIAGGHYAEPYAGGASLALSLLLSGRVSEIHLNDLDRSIWAFWKYATEDSADLISRIYSTPITVDEWLKQKHVQTIKKHASIADLGFSTLFLNRTNRSGIINAGIIGGKEQKGKWKIDARFNKEDLANRIRAIAAYKSQIHVTRLDALVFIQRRGNSLPIQQSLMYLDPPYFVKGQDLYMNSYKPDDHIAVASTVLEKVKIPWLVSYDDVPEIRKLYTGTRRITYTLNYSASTTRKGDEIMFIAPHLRAQSKLLIRNIKDRAHKRSELLQIQ